MPFKETTTTATKMMPDCFLVSFDINLIKMHSSYQRLLCTVFFFILLLLLFSFFFFVKLFIYSGDNYVEYILFTFFQSASYFYLVRNFSFYFPVCFCFLFYFNKIKMSPLNTFWYQKFYQGNRKKNQNKYTKQR